MGFHTAEAYTRLRAGERLRDKGDSAEANEQLEQALAFYRYVGATRYIREADGLLATIQADSEEPAAQQRA
jgi:hypothetical protein